MMLKNTVMTAFLRIALGKESCFSLAGSTEKISMKMCGWGIGYSYMRSLGYDEVARVCLTHSFNNMRLKKISKKKRLKIFTKFEY